MWPGDNAIFNVNGEGVERLKKTLQLAFEGKTVFGYKYIQKLGLVLYNYESGKDICKFPVPITPEQVAPIVIKWLDSEEAKKVPK